MLLDDRLPIALIGYGGSGSGIHRALIESIPSLRIDTVVTRDEQRASKARHQIPGVRVEADVSGAAHCAVAVVALPPGFRRPVVDQLLATGMRVVLEKPMAASLNEAQSLAEMAGPNQLAVFQNRRWDADFLTLQRLKAEGAWSGPVRFESRIQWWQPQLRESWRNDPTGGGLLMEVGTHLIDQALALLGPVVDVHAELASMREGALAEDDVFLALQHADGSRSHLFAGALGDDSLPRFQLASGDTLITLEEPDRQQRQMAEGIMPGHQIWGEVQPQRWEIRRGTDPIRSVLPERGCWEVFYARVVDWVIAGAEPPVSAEEGVATMRIIDAARSGASRVRVDEAV